jgi:hypothetical protein
MALTQVDQGLLGTNAQYTGFKNRIINGAMVIDQRNAGAIVTPIDAQYTLDRWKFNISQSAKFTVQQTPSATETGYATRVAAGFTNYLACTSSSAYPVSSGDYFLAEQDIEGLNCFDLAWGTASAKSVTLSFWVYSSLTGTFGGALVNSGLNRSYPFSYTINSASTWEQKTITIAGDTSGTWLTTNGVGIRVRFGIGVGTTYSGTAGSWAATNYVSATGATSVVGTNLATFYLTGVQLEKGSTATSFDYRPYGTELQLCQRYYWQSTSKANGTQFWEYSGAVTDGTTVRINFYLPTAMRTQPSIAINPVYNTGSSWQINVTGITNYALTQAPTILGNDGAAGGGGNMIAIAFKSSGISSAQYGLGAIPYATTGTATNNFQFSAEL